MFTGIVQELAEVKGIQSSGPGARLEVRLSFADEVETGESIAVNGACLTVSNKGAGVVSFDVVGQTLSVTTLKSLRSGERVNVERALLPTERMGGHIVSGHIDGIGRVLRKESVEGGTSMWFSIPEGVRALVAERGSIAVDGVSLTVAEVKGDEFRAALVPHTLANTTLGGRNAGDEVNIEADMLARYVHRALTERGFSQGMSEEWLREKGF